MSDKRQQFAEYLLLQAAAGLRDTLWTAQFMAFQEWCHRLDHAIPPTPDASVQAQQCPNCRHDYHPAQPCGTPMIGEGYPHHDVCLCGQKPTTHPSLKNETTLDRDVLRYAFDWMDEASSILRCWRTRDAKIKRRIHKLISRKGGFFSLFTPRRKK